MKAVLVLVILYVGAFLIAIQGASPNSVQAQSVATEPRQGVGASMDSAKEADIRALMDLTGAQDVWETSAARTAGELRDNLQASVPANVRGRQFVKAFAGGQERRLYAEQAADQSVDIYNRHFSAEEIRALRKFYESALGQKFAAESPRIAAEMETAYRAGGLRAAQQALQDLHGKYPDIKATARLTNAESAPSTPSGAQISTTNQAVIHP